MRSWGFPFNLVLIFLFTDRNKRHSGVEVSEISQITNISESNLVYILKHFILYSSSRSCLMVRSHWQLQYGRHPARTVVI